ncbi:MAG: phage tail tape measure protein [Bacteroidales bacterium]|nr:phage tail tape measure protein [Bacteroidales bacterium]
MASGTELAKAYVQIVPSVQGISSDLEKSLQGITSQANDAEKAVNKVGDAAGDASGDLSGMAGSADNAADDLQDTGTAADNASGDLSNVGTAADGAADSLDAIDGSGAAEQLENAATSADGLSDSLDSIDGTAAVTEMDNAATSASGLADNLDAIDADGFMTAMDEAAGSADGLSDALDSIDATGAALEMDDAADSAEGLAGSLDEIDGSVAADSLDDAAGSAEDAAGSFDDLGAAADNMDFSGLGDQVFDLGSSFADDLAGNSDIAQDSIGLLEGAIGAFASGNVIGGCIEVVSGLADMIGDLIDREQEAEAIIAQGTGATGDALNQFGDLAQYVYANVDQAADISFTDVANTLAELNTMFDLEGEELAETGELMQDFAVLTGQDGAEAVDKLKSIMSLYGIETEKLPTVLDSLMQAQTLSSASAGDLETALINNAASFQAIGYDIDDAMTWMAAYDKAGGNSSDTTRILNSFMNNLDDDMENAPEIWQNLCDAMEDSSNMSEAMGQTISDSGLKISDVFSEKYARTISTVMTSAGYDVDAMAEKMEDCSGVFDQISEDSVTNGDKWAKFWDLGSVSANDYGEALEAMAKKNDEEMGEIEAGTENAMEEIAKDGEEGANTFATGFLGKIMALFGIGSPSKEMEKIGGYLGDGLEIGMDDMDDKIQGPLDDTLKAIDNFTDDVDSALDKSSTDVVDNVVKIYKDLPKQLGDVFDDAIDTIKDFGKDSQKQQEDDANDTVKDVIKIYDGMAKDLGKSLDSSLSTMKTFGNDAQNQMYTVGQNVVQGLINGMSSMNNTLYNSVRNQMSQVVNQAKSELGISSPSKVFEEEVGEMIPAGIVAGIDEGTSDVQSALEALLTLSTVEAKSVYDMAINSSMATTQATQQMASSLTYGMNEVIMLLNKYLPQYAEMGVYVNGKTLVGEIASDMNKALGQIAVKEARRG